MRDNTKETIDEAFNNIDEALTKYRSAIDKLEVAALHPDLDNNIKKEMFTVLNDILATVDIIIDDIQVLNTLEKHIQKSDAARPKNYRYKEQY